MIKRVERRRKIRLLGIKAIDEDGEKYTCPLVL
jgi:hypothetical protein